jgi:hypothetical protein
LLGISLGEVIEFFLKENLATLHINKSTEGSSLTTLGVFSQFKRFLEGSNVFQKIA